MADEIRDDIGDPELSRRYRELAQEEPGRDVDAAILAAARRAAETRPAPLVAPTARRRWYFPLAAAAVIVLAVAVTVQVERNQPDVDGVAPPPAPPPPAVTPQASPRAAESGGMKASKERKDGGAQTLQEAPAKVETFSRAAPAAPESEARDTALERQGVAGAAAGTLSAQHAPAPAAAMRPQMQARALAKVEPPEQALERIAELRRQGKDDEADKALAEFRKRYPDFKISEETLKKVERR